MFIVNFIAIPKILLNNIIYYLKLSKEILSYLISLPNGIRDNLANFNA